MSNRRTVMSPHSLPTPGPSTEILGKAPSANSVFGQIDASFSLPPAAIASNATDSNPATSPSPANSDSSYRPLSPPAVSTSAATARPEKVPATRRRSSANSKENNGSQNRNGYTVPPPPTRSRKIIQMKPQVQQDPQEATLSTSTPNARSHAAAPSGQGAQATGSKPTPAAAAGTKRKQSTGASTAAGRKTARKTAHSLIERRRRSKMNEEFGVLKDMIPACTGQEMHKLASQSLHF
jgi:hypothetical protein